MTEHQDALEELDALVAAKERSRRAAILCAVAALAALAVIPRLLGAGWFGARVVLAREVPIHVLNTSGQDLVIKVPFASATTVRAGTIETVETLAGPVALEAFGEDGERAEFFEFDAQVPVVYNALGSECLAVFDLTPFYGGEHAAPLRVLDRISRDERLVELDAGTLILPRRTPPDQATAPVHWVEVVGCTLLDPSEEAYLVGQAEFRLQERRTALEEAREAAR